MGGGTYSETLGIKLPDNGIVFQAEISAIQVVVETILNRHAKIANMDIFSFRGIELQKCV